MRNDQKKFLKDKLEESYRLQRDRLPGGRWANPRQTDRPEEVVTAEKELARLTKVVERWRSKERKRLERIHDRLTRAYRKAKEALLFHDPDKALAAVNKFTAPTDNDSDS